MNKTQQTVIVPLYLNRFSCIGPDCEDHCCQHWKIQVDKTHFKNIKAAMKANGEENQLKERLKINRTPQSSANNYAEIVLTPEKNCSFLNENRLCGLQCAYGEDILPDVCQIYPRKQVFNGKRIEIYASLSCPEVARQCLLTSDSMCLVEADQELRRKFGSFNNHHAMQNGYHRYLNEVRTTMFELLNPARYSLQERLFLMLFFAIRTEPDFYQNIDHDPGAQLKQHVDYIQTAETQAEIMGLIDGIVCSTEKPLMIVLRMLMNVKSTAFTGEILLNAMGQNVNHSNVHNKPIAMNQVYQQFKRRADAVEARLGNRVNQYFTHYAMNYWLSEWFTNSENLVVHLRKLLVRIACLRFMLFNSSDCLTLLETDDLAMQTESLDRAAVKVFYQFSRMYEHNPAIIEKIENDIESHGYGQPVLASLIRF